MTQTPISPGAGRVTPASRRSRDFHRRIRRQFNRRGRRQFLCKAAEEIVSDLFGRTIDQTLTDLRQFATHSRFGGVGENGAVAFRRQNDLRIAFRKARDTTLAFTREAAAMWRIEIGEADLSLKGRFYRPDLQRCGRDKVCWVGLFDLLAAGDARLKCIGVV